MSNNMKQKMVAICGMNCTTCYKHLTTKKYAKKCNGCKYDDDTLPNHCRQCKIKDCAKSKHLNYCFKCKEYPCKWMNALDKSYTKRYKISLIQNGYFIKENSMKAFLKDEKIKWCCTSCNGVISLHDNICSECKKIIHTL